MLLSSKVARLRLSVGCGRFFEGTPAEMHTALNETLAALPDETKVYVNITILLLFPRSFLIKTARS